MYGLELLKIRPVTGSFEAHPFTAKAISGNNILSFIVLLQRMATPAEYIGHKADNL
jgi:hypothetical protein